MFPDIGSDEGISIQLYNARFRGLDTVGPRRIGGVQNYPFAPSITTIRGLLHDAQKMRPKIV